MGEPRDVVRSKFEGFNAHDMQETMKHYSPDTEREVPGVTLRGADQVAAWISAFWEAFPDLKVTITSDVEEGPVIVVQASATGTHRGTLRTPAGDIPPTGRGASLRCADRYEVRGGVIVSSQLHFDRLELLEQLGVTPAPAPA